MKVFYHDDKLGERQANQAQNKIIFSTSGVYLEYFLPFFLEFIVLFYFLRGGRR